jgi:hypothetical protein
MASTSSPSPIANCRSTRQRVGAPLTAMASTRTGVRPSPSTSEYNFTWTALCCSAMKRLGTITTCSCVLTQLLEPPVMWRCIWPVSLCRPIWATVPTPPRSDQKITSRRIYADLPLYVLSKCCTDPIEPYRRPKQDRGL